MPFHVGFSDDLSGSELSHWQSRDLSFFQLDGSKDAVFSLEHLRFSNSINNKETYLSNGSLTFKEPGGMMTPEDKMRLTKEELIFYNDASYQAINAHMSAGVGRIYLNAQNGVRNVGLTNYNGASRGYVFVADGAGDPQAGIYINELDQGIVFADVKNFRVKHPEKSQKEIWYASLEGPEVGAYDRGTANLVNGETFVEFQDHFKHIANTSKMTVHVTPHNSDTYGLAVIEKKKNGFYVKELKGGSGNFSFDWEVKCIRTGKEKFQVVRDIDPGLNPAPEINGHSKISNQKSNTLQHFDMKKHIKDVYNH